MKKCESPQVSLLFSLFYMTQAKISFSMEKSPHLHFDMINICWKDEKRQEKKKNF